MKISFQSVVEYVKDLCPLTSLPVVSVNPQLDAETLAYMATDKFYTVATNGGKYWYYATDEQDMDVAQYILRSNGIRAQKHNSHVAILGLPVLRVGMSHLKRVNGGRGFVDNVMHIVPKKLDEKQICGHIEQIRQKIR